MIETKLKNKDWNISRVSSKYKPNELLDAWKKTLNKEFTLRKQAIKSLDGFKKWFFEFIKYRKIYNNVCIIRQGLESKQNQSDNDKDWLDERNRIYKEIEDKFDSLKEINNLLVENKAKVRQYIKQDKDLRPYKPWFELEYFWNIKHKLTEKNKEFLSHSWGTRPIRDIYNTMFDCYSPEQIKDEEGKVVAFKSWNDAFKNANPFIRQSAYESIWGFEANHRDSLFIICKAIAKRTNQEAQYYNYESWVHGIAEDRYHVPFKDFAYTLDHILKFTPLMSKFRRYNNKLICKGFNLDKINPWDERIEFENRKDSINKNQAIKLIYDSLACLGPDYKKQIDWIFSKNIIRWTINAKEDNGYCYGGIDGLDVSPIQFNWDGSSISATTLSHEIGHSVNSNLIQQNNKIIKEDNSVLCEIPSIVNTVLTNLYLIDKFKQTNVPKQYLYGIYNELISYLLNNICYKGFIMQFTGLATDNFCDKRDFKPGQFEEQYVDLYTYYLGYNKLETNKFLHKYPYTLLQAEAYRVYPKIVLDRNIALEYYIGAIVGLYIGTKIYQGDKKTLDKYLKFLTKCKCLDPIKLVKDTLNMDLLKPEIYTKSKKLLSKLVNNFIKDIKI